MSMSRIGEPSECHGVVSVPSVPLCPKCTAHEAFEEKLIEEEANQQSRADICSIMIHDVNVGRCR
jgi:hypothetical protein